MKTLGLTVVLLILSVVFITPSAYADGDEGGRVFFGITVGPPIVFYGPPPLFWPPDDEGYRYRPYHRYDRDRRYRGDDDRGRDEDRDWAYDRDYGHRHHWRDDDHEEAH